MRTAFVASFLANLILSLLSLAILPDPVAVHFGRGGVPDRWASSLESALMMLGVQTLLFCSLYFSPGLVAKLPGRWVSLPNKDHWLTPQQRPRAVEILSALLWQFGTALFLFMLFAGLLTLRANLSNPVRLDEHSLMAALAILLAYCLYWTVALLRAFRVPK